VIEVSGSEVMATQYISVTDALKLVSPFSGNRKEILTFVSNVDTAFSCIKPEDRNRLYQFVLTKVSGEPRTAISHRNLETWEELKEFLKNTYIEKRTLDFHANQLFRAKQNKAENVSEWIQKIQTLGSKFRESALLNCSEEERAGILNLSDKLRNICFIQGLYSDRIQTIVRSRNNENFDEIAETALEEESAIISKQERYRGEIGTPSRYGNYGKLGYATQTCFLRKNPKVGQAKVNQARVERPKRSPEIICYSCKEKGHYARNCPRNMRGGDKRNAYQEKAGNGNRLPENNRPTVGSAQ
jgi:hypothetical protein